MKPIYTKPAAPLEGFEKVTVKHATPNVPGAFGIPSADNGAKNPTSEAPLYVSDDHFPQWTDTEKKLEEFFYGKVPQKVTESAAVTPNVKPQTIPSAEDPLNWVSNSMVPEPAVVAARSEEAVLLEELNKQIARLNTNVNKLAELDVNIDKSLNQLNAQRTANGLPPVHRKPYAPIPIESTIPKYDVILTLDDLRALERMLSSELEIPKHVNIKGPEHIGSYMPGTVTQPSMVETLHSANTELERNMTMAKKEGWVQEPDGTRKCYKNGKLHCDTGPAEIRDNGTQLYYKHGKLHRDGGQPAMMAAGGTVKYAVDGKYHRLGGLPAITWSKSPYRQEWWENGEVKRAVKKDGTQEWYAPGSTDREEAVLHRTDGPALIHPRGQEEFWLNGNQYRNRQDWEAALTAINSMRDEALDRDLIDEDPIEEIYDQDVVAATETSEARKLPKEKKMNKPSFTEIMKNNAREAGYRVAATQSTNIVKNAILAVMKNKGSDEGALAAISAFLDTEFGASLVSFALGTGLNYVPHFSEDPRVQKLGEEMRINGMATAGNAIIGEAMQHVLPALTEVLNKLPAVENSGNVRLEEAKDTSLVERLEEDEETSEESTARKTATA